MKQKIESIADLEKLDRGLIREMFKRELAFVMADLDARPAVKKPRRLVVELLFVPKLDERGLLGGIELEAGVSTKMPGSRTRPFHTLPVEGALCFDDLSPDNARQMTMPVE